MVPRRDSHDLTLPSARHTLAWQRPHTAHAGAPVARRPCAWPDVSRRRPLRARAQHDVPIAHAQGLLASSSSRAPCPSAAISTSSSTRSARCCCGTSRSPEGPTVASRNTRRFQKTSLAVSRCARRWRSQSMRKIPVPWSGPSAPISHWRCSKHSSVRLEPRAARYGARIFTNAPSSPHTRIGALGPTSASGSTSTNPSALGSSSSSRVKSILVDSSWPGAVPAIHEFPQMIKDVDGRHKAGHNLGCFCLNDITVVLPNVADAAKAQYNRYGLLTSSNSATPARQLAAISSIATCCSTCSRNAGEPARMSIGILSCSYS